MLSTHLMHEKEKKRKEKKKKGQGRKKDKKNKCWFFAQLETSLIAQLVKNPPAMREIWVRSLGWEKPLEKGKATHSSILAWSIPWTV